MLVSRCAGKNINYNNYYHIMMVLGCGGVGVSCAGVGLCWCCWLWCPWLALAALGLALPPPRCPVARRAPRPPARCARAVRVGAVGSVGGAGAGGCRRWWWWCPCFLFFWGGRGFAPPPLSAPASRSRSFFIYFFYVCHFVKSLLLIWLRLSFCQAVILSCFLSHCQSFMSFFVYIFASDFVLITLNFCIMINPVSNVDDLRAYIVVSRCQTILHQRVLQSLSNPSDGVPCFGLCSVFAEFADTYVDVLGMPTSVGREVLVPLWNQELAVKRFGADMIDGFWWSIGDWQVRLRFLDFLANYYGVISGVLNYKRG